MALIEIASQAVPNYHYSGTVHELWFFSDRSWIAEDGSPVQGRGADDAFYEKYTLAVAGTTATIPIVSLLSHNDAPNEKAGKYMAYFYVDGTEKDMFLPNTLGSFRIPSTPLTTTWKDVETFNSTPRRDYQDWRTYSAVQINGLLEDLRQELYAAIAAA